jgi:hypothetical protein
LAATAEAFAVNSNLFFLNRSSAASSLKKTTWLNVCAPACRPTVPIVMVAVPISLPFSYTSPAPCPPPTMNPALSMLGNTT